MRSMYCFVCLLLCQVAFAQSVPEPDGQWLRAVVSDTNSPPYAIFDLTGNLSSGISKDIVDELGRQLKVKVDYLNLPRARVLSWLQEGQADIACFLNPEWVNEPDTVLWSVPLFNTQQLIIRRHRSSAIRSVTQLAGKRIGTTRGFTYPELAILFQTKSAIRDDSNSLESNLLRLQQHRLDVVMTVDLSFDYYVSIFGNDDFSADPLWAQPSSVHCALSKLKPQRANLIFSLLKQQVDEGYIQKRLTAYKTRPVLNGTKAVGHL